MKQHISPNESSLKRTLRYSMGGIVCLLYLAFCYWAGWGWIIFFPLIADYYFTKYINWGWGRNHPNKAIATLVGLLGDLLYVVIAVTFIFTFFFQNFGIPTSSLEKTLLTGDYLFVSKLKYGPRMPITPLGLPLIHNRLGNSETYSTTLTLPYKRLAGYGEIERNDLVVFNFPAGDTIASKMTNPDYLSLCEIYGRELVHTDRAQFGDIIYRPIDRRDHYVKRLIGMPGDKLEIRDAQVYINDIPAQNPEKMQLNYLVQTKGMGLSRELLDALYINYRDVQPIFQGGEASTQTDEYIKQLSDNYRQRYGLEITNVEGHILPLYEIPLTSEMVERLQAEPNINRITRVKIEPGESLCYPVGSDYGWSIDNYGAIIIPKQGMTIELNHENYPLYERCIRAYEGHKLEERDGKYYIDGKETSNYTFAQNYYWMMGDNRHNSADSRAWGFVPEDHIVGTPSLLWLSLNDEQPLFKGGIRWGRMFRFIKAH